MFHPQTIYHMEGVVYVLSSELLLASIRDPSLWPPCSQVPSEPAADQSHSTVESSSIFPHVPGALLGSHRYGCQAETLGPVVHWSKNKPPGGQQVGFLVKSG